MTCSHGLAYESKCSMCFSEAMARVLAVVKSEGVKHEPPKGPTCYDPRDLREVLDRNQQLP